jgi:hypothetical protein
MGITGRIKSLFLVFIGEKGTYKISVVKSKRNKTLLRPRHRWKDKNKYMLEKNNVENYGLNSTVLNVMMNLRISLKKGSLV